MAWMLHAMTVVASSNVPPAVQPSARVMPPAMVTPGSMLAVGSVEVTAVPDEAVVGAGSTAGAGSVGVTAAAGEAVDGAGSTAGAGSVTTDGCSVVSESPPQAAKAANARTMNIVRKNRIFTSVLFDEDFHLFQ